MSNWTELQKLKERVTVLETDVNALKHARFVGVNKAAKPEKVRGAFIPLPDVDMRVDEKRMPAPIAVRFPDGTHRPIAGWKPLKVAVAEDVGVEDWFLDVLKTGHADRHGSMETAQKVAKENAAQYAIAFEADCDMYPTAAANSS